MAAAPTADASEDGAKEASAPASADASTDGGGCISMRFVLASIINHNQYGRNATGALVVAVEIRAVGRKPERVYLPNCNGGDYPSCFNFSACSSRNDFELTCTLGKSLFAIALERGDSGVAVVRFVSESEAGAPPSPPIAVPDLRRFGCYVLEPAVKGERVIYTDL
jgi:hypothetical protein